MRTWLRRRVACLRGRHDAQWTYSVRRGCVVSACRRCPVEERWTMRKVA